MSRLIVSVITFGTITLFVVYVVGLGLMYAIPLAVMASLPRKRNND